MANVGGYGGADLVEALNIIHIVSDSLFTFLVL